MLIIGVTGCTLVSKCAGVVPCVTVKCSASIEALQISSKRESAQVSKRAM